MLNVTATGLPRLLVCNGSRLMGSTPSAHTVDVIKDEGNAADWMIGQVFAGHHQLEELVDRKAPNDVYITAEMAEHLLDYLAWVCGKGEVERDCSYGGRAWSVAGRADHVFYDQATGVLYISDFKYGWKIVDVVDNWTLISHAVGWMVQTGIMPAAVEYRIYQPRPYHPDGSVRTHRVDGADIGLRLTHITGILDNLTDKLVTSKHCYKCPSLATCPAAQMAGMNAIDVSVEAFNSEPDNDQVEFLIEETEKAMTILKQNLTAYEDLALHRLKHGQLFKNYAIQNDLGRETWRDDVTPEFVEMMTGKDVTKKALVTPKQAIKAGVSPEFIESLTTRPNKGVKLVRQNANEHAKKFLNQRS